MHTRDARPDVGARRPGQEAADRTSLVRWLPPVALLVVLAATAGPAVAQRPAGGVTVRGGMLSFAGHVTPLGDFEGRTTSVSGQVITAEPAADFRGWVEAPVRTLTTGSRLQDRGLNQLMDSERYPVIRFELNGLSTRGTEETDSVGATLHGSLRIHGVTREIEVPGIVTRVNGDTRFVARFPVKLTDYEIRGLTRGFGLVRIDEEIFVGVDLVFGPADAGGQ